MLFARVFLPSSNNKQTGCALLFLCKLRSIYITVPHPTHLENSMLVTQESSTADYGQYWGSDARELNQEHGQTRAKQRDVFLLSFARMRSSLN